MAGLIHADLPPGVEALLDAAIEGEMGDGLPVVPPTREAVRRMLSETSLSPNHVLGIMAPGMREVTVEEGAVCAVAAGCKPAYFPVVVAALDAIMDPEFNLLAIQATTELASPLLVVNGRLRRSWGYMQGADASGRDFGRTPPSAGRFGWRPCGSGKRFQARRTWRPSGTEGSSRPASRRPRAPGSRFTWNGGLRPVKAR